MYSMVPQAAGAKNATQVSNMLTMSVVWTCGILLLPVAVAYFFFGSLINVPESVDAAYGYGDGGNASGCGDIIPLLEPAVATGQEVVLEAELLEAEFNETLALLISAEEAGVQGEDEECDLKCTITSYTRACIWYLWPFILVETARCWLGSLEIVTILAPNAGFWALTRVPLYALLMFPLGLGLNGYAFGMLISTAGELIGTYLIVVLWKKPHLQWWEGIDWKGASDRALNWRFVKLGSAASVQLLASFASGAVLYSLMASRSEVHLAAYGVLQGFTHMGSSLSHALFTATSICVGTRLGAADPDRSKQAALAGVYYNLILGFGLAAALLVNPEGLSLMLVPNDEDAQTRKVVVDAIVPTAACCVLQSLQWGFWSVLEGQARVSITSVFIIIGWWVVGLPGSFLTLHLIVADPCSTDGSASKDITAVMWCLSAGFLACDLMMAYAVIFCDWQALSDEAVANAKEAEEDEQEDDKSALSAPDSPDTPKKVDGVAETAMVVLDEWLERWNALDEKVWNTNSVLFQEDGKGRALNEPLELPLIPAGDDNGSGSALNGASDKFSRMLKQLKAVGWHHSRWKRREVMIDSAQPDKIKLGTVCVRYTEDNQLLGEFESEYEAERVPERAGLWKLKFLGVDDLPRVDEQGQ